MVPAGAWTLTVLALMMSGLSRYASSFWQMREMALCGRAVPWHGGLGVRGKWSDVIPSVVVEDFLAGGAHAIAIIHHHHHHHSSRPHRTARSHTHTHTHTLTA